MSPVMGAYQVIIQVKAAGLQWLFAHVEPLQEDLINRAAQPNSARDYLTELVLRLESRHYSHHHDSIRIHVVVDDQPQ